MQRSSQTSRQALLDGFGTLIGDDEHGGACGRVRCIGAHSVRAAKQWVPEDGSKIKSWLALRNHRTSWWLSLSDSTMLHSWSFTAGSCARTASGEAASLKRTSSARPHIQKHLGNGEPRSFQQTGAGPRIFHRLARYWPGPPEIARPC